MWKNGIKIDGACPLYHQEKENMNYLFKTCDVAKAIWSKVNASCPYPNNSDISFIDWLKQIWKINCGITKFVQSSRKSIAIVWAIWNNRKNITF